MKKIITMAILINLLGACQKEYKEIGSIPSKVEGITARWVLHSCSMVDKGGFIEETVEITPFFTSAAKLPNITFTMDAGVGRYTCDTSNVAFQFFGGTGGSWNFDNAEFPTRLIITPNGATQSIIMPLVATIRPTDTYLKIDQSVLCGTTEKAVYRLSFIRN